MPAIEPAELRKKSNEIQEIDQLLDAAAGSLTAGRRAIANDLAKENETSWKKPADQVKVVLGKIDDIQVLVGVYTGIRDALATEFKKRVDEYLDAEAKKKVEENKVTLTSEQVSELETKRKKLVQQFHILEEVLELYEEDISDIPKPKKRSGARGKRGPRVLTNYDFFIDGEKRSDTQNTLSSIANTVTKDLGWKVMDLRNYIETQEWNGEKIVLENPPESFEVLLPETKEGEARKTLRAVRGEAKPEEVQAQDDVEVESDDDDDDDNGDDDGTE